jgi:hypothetical protein
MQPSGPRTARRDAAPFAAPLDEPGQAVGFSRIARAALFALRTARTAGGIDDVLASAVH